jgi:hypothetical protein
LISFVAVKESQRWLRAATTYRRYREQTPTGYIATFGNRAALARGNRMRTVAATLSLQHGEAPDFAQNASQLDLVRKIFWKGVVP